MTLLVATLRLVPHAHGLAFELTGRLFAVGAALGAGWHFARRLRSTTGALAMGVVALRQADLSAARDRSLPVGVVRQLIQPEWIQALAGQNDVVANAAAVAFGVFMYFPTLVEVPVARMFLDLGMHQGPLLAYLMADPELSLQSMLMVAAVIGRTKTFAYVGLVALFSIAAGLLTAPGSTARGSAESRSGFRASRPCSRSSSQRYMRDGRTPCH